MPLYLGNNKIEDVEVAIQHRYTDTVTELPGGGEQHTIIADLDLSQDTVTPESLLIGYTAHNASGQPIAGAAEPSGILNVTTMSSSTTTLNAYVYGITELNITAGSATAAKYCNKFNLYDIKFPSVCDVNYIGMSGMTSSTSLSDCLRQCNGIRVIDFGGVNAPATLTRFYYNVTKQNYEKNYTMYIKGINWTNTTTFTNCFAPSTGYTSWASDNWDLDVEWNGTINATTLSLGGTAKYPFTHRSLLELFNALSTNGGTLSIGADNLAKMTSAEIAIATGKGWTVS